MNIPYNDNKPATIKGYIIDIKEEVIKINGSDIDKVTLVIASKTKDRAESFRDQVFEVSAYNGAIAASAQNIKRAKEALKNGDACTGTFVVWINGDTYEVKKDYKDRRKNPEMVKRYSIRLSLESHWDDKLQKVIGGFTLISYPNEPYVFEGEKKKEAQTLEELLG